MSKALFNRLQTATVSKKPDKALKMLLVALRRPVGRQPLCIMPLHCRCVRRGPSDRALQLQLPAGLPPLEAPKVAPLLDY